MVKKLHWLLPTVFILYISSSLFVLNTTTDLFPVTVTNILSLSYALFLPMVVVLNAMGFVDGEMWIGPTKGGIILGMVFYSFLLYVLGKRLQKYLQDDAPPSNCE